ncbi:ATP-binding protein [Streptomyces sp. NPDC058001]|uniref:ATP-binding protein n=1 Tax=Streptomyces sp. NPDC058001 TaxID=3346300 RepID=UPI0036EFC784
MLRVGEVANVPRRTSFRLPRHPASVGLARRRAREHLAGSGVPPDDTDDLVLIVSELVTDVVRDGPDLEREFEVAITVLPDGSCLVEVADEYRPAPEPRALCDLLESLCVTWGTGPHTTWAVIPPKPPTLPKPPTTT